ncbi:MAG: LytTR family DNA-binding domain-containing protein [Cyclobacteriaceae bacterium]
MQKEQLNYGNLSSRMGVPALHPVKDFHGLREPYLSPHRSWVKESAKKDRSQDGRVMQNEHLPSKCLFIKSSGRYWRICPDQILFVQAAGSYVHIQTILGRYTLSQNLTSFTKKTPLANLSRVHRSYLVNVTRIDSFAESFLFIENHKIPLSESYKDEFMARVHCL